MGYHSLIAFSHDAFDRIERSPMEFMAALRRYMNSGMRNERGGLEDVTHDAVKVVAMRHHSDQYVISNKEHGFPSVLPFAEEAEARKLRDASVMKEASEFLCGVPKKLTIAKCLDVIEKLLNVTFAVRSAIDKAKDADERMTRKLSDPNWRPSRAHVEGLRNTLSEIHKA